MNEGEAPDEWSGRCVCTFNDERSFIVSSINVPKTYKTYYPLCAVFTKPIRVSTATKTTQNFSNSSLKIAMRGVL